MNCGVLDEYEVPSASQMQRVLAASKSLIKTWDALGIHVWTEEEGLLFLNPGQVDYLIGGTTTDRAVDAYSYRVTTLAAAAASGATTISVTSIAGMSAGDEIGIILDSGATHWTTISAPPSGSTLHLTAGLAGPAAPIANDVFSYPPSAVIGKPLKMPGARTLLWVSMQETPMSVMARQQYMTLPNKKSLGNPNQFFFAPRRDQGEFHPWPAPLNSANAIRFTWYRQIQIYTGTNDTGDLPDEWTSAIEWNTSLELGVSFATSEPRWNRIVTMAASRLEEVQEFDRESEPIQFSMADDETSYGD